MKAFKSAAMPAGKILQSTLNLKPYTFRVVETKARQVNQNITYGGTVRNVGAGQTYTTLTSAFAAAGNGDIFQLFAGTYEINAETGGYWLINRPGIGVKIRGNASDPSAVIIRRSAANSYGIRVRDAGQLTFENITFESQNYSGSLITQDSAYTSRFIKFKNCIFNQTSATASACFSRVSSTADTNSVYIEFETCTLNSNATNDAIYYLNSGINEKLLITGCTFNCSATYSFRFDATHKGSIAVYDSAFTQSVSNYIMQFGSDESVPANSTFLIDCRNNSLAYSDSFAHHAILLGRGTNKVYCVNNTIDIPSVNNSLAVGIVIKTIAPIVGDSYIAGNKITAPRPIYVKGGQKNYIRYNTAISNQADWESFGVNNPAADRLSTLNQVHKNNFIGQRSAIINYRTVTVEDSDVTMQGWQMDNNNYYSQAGVWAIKADNTQHQFATKETFWTNSNDASSKLLNSPSLGPEKLITDTIVIN